MKGGERRPSKNQEIIRNHLERVDVGGLGRELGKKGKRTHGRERKKISGSTFF